MRSFRKFLEATDQKKPYWYTVYDHRDREATLVKIELTKAEKAEWEKKHPNDHLFDKEMDAYYNKLYWEQN
jgi:hypothetical protein